MRGLDRNDSATIGFVIACLFCEAIDRNEFRAWADYVLASTNDYPAYIVDISQFDGPLKDIFGLIGFSPVRGLNDEQGDAIFGIAYARGREPYECKLSREEAIGILRKHSEILEEFRRTFPFLHVNF